MSYYYPVTHVPYAQYPSPAPLAPQPMLASRPLASATHLPTPNGQPYIVASPVASPVLAPTVTTMQRPPANVQVQRVRADSMNPSYADGKLLEQGAASERRRTTGSPTGGTTPEFPPAAHHDPEVLVYPEDPISAVELLRAGNERFVRGQVLAPHRNMERVKNLAGGQNPFAAFLSCADSRVPVEILFDQGFGDIFVVRVAGNVSNPEVVGSLEFGTSVLGAKVLYVLGHTACGAVRAAGTDAGEDVPGLVSSLFYHVKPALRAVNGDVDAAVGENVKLQARQLAEVSPIIRTLIRQKKLIVVGGVYDLESGEVKEVCQITEVPSVSQ